MPAAVTTMKLDAVTIDEEISSTDSFRRLPAIVNDDAEQEGLYTPIASSRPSKASGADEVHDLLCIGFGPASIAIAIALHESPSSPNVCFLERQPKFAWHSGMQLPGAKMQISFLKDLATPRNPRSHFTFLNYLYKKKRLNNYINLGSFLPTRYEYEDYLRWCAGHFDSVAYGQEVVEVVPDVVAPGGKVTQFRVVSRDVKTNALTTRLARRVVISAGGKPAIPQEFPRNHPRVIHSSQYSTRVSAALRDPSKPYNIAVVGSGQSAAEIFNDLPARYPNATVTLVIRGAALRPSDDSPFVNEVFDPDRVDAVYAQGASARAAAIKADRATNYGVVRLDLLDHMYEKLYVQKLKSADPRGWKIRIRNNTRVVSTREEGEKVVLRLGKVRDDGVVDGGEEEMQCDAVFFATGYVRNAHEAMLEGARGLLRESDREGGKFPVRRDYGVDFDEGKVARGAGVWLQGCNEGTHGLSDTLLSILAVRSGELVRSMFGEELGVAALRSKL